MKALDRSQEQQARDASSAEKPKKKGPVLGPNGKPMNKKEQKQQENLEKMHRNLYAANERILLVGEGNFTFARALCKHLGSGDGVYASCFDSETELKRKYADAGKIRKEIEESLGGTILTGVDGTRLHKVKEFRGAFRKIVFNFPHMGTGEKDVEKNIAQHRQLMASFFSSAVKCLDPKHDSAIHVALKTGEPYKSWKIVQTARAAAPELDLSTAIPFMPTAWEGYAHRRTAGFSDLHSPASCEELSKGAKVYVFRKPGRRPQQEASDE